MEGEGTSLIWISTDIASYNPLVLVVHGWLECPDGTLYLQAEHRYEESEALLWLLSLSVL